jgi:hypothetical protein
MAQGIDVTIDFAKILTLDRPAETIVVGNPGIADASVEDEKTIVLTGKTAGATNLIVLDGEGKEIVNAVVRVSSRRAHADDCILWYAAADILVRADMRAGDLGRRQPRAVRNGEEADREPHGFLHRPSFGCDNGVTVALLRRNLTGLAARRLNFSAECNAIGWALIP